MKIKKGLLLYPLILAILSCQPKPEREHSSTNDSDSSRQRKETPSNKDSTINQTSYSSVSTGNTDPQQLVSFALRQQGIPYKYGSTDPSAGFDCSGFITYVFNHFHISVPRSSADFKDAGKEIARRQSRPGDLILFTGTDSTDSTIGHMGIIVSNQADSIKFVHSTSGKANGVTVTPLNVYYEGRFVKIIRVFDRLDQE